MGVNLKQTIFTWISLTICLTVILLFGSSATEIQAQEGGELQGSAASQDLPPFPELPKGKLSYRLGKISKTPQVGAQDIEALSEDLSVPATGPGSLMISEAGDLLIYIRVTDTSQATLDQVTAAGADIVHVAEEYRIVTAHIGFDELDGLAALDVVEAAQEVLAPIIGSSQRETESIETDVNIPDPQIACPPGPLVSEGVQIMGVDAVQNAGVTGNGIKVGVLSDSYNRKFNLNTTAAIDIALGDLPGFGNPCGRFSPVTVIQDDLFNLSSDLKDEGRAMLHIVHDIAPDADLSFATANGGIYNFAENIRNLRKAGAEVIVDDVTYFEEPFYQEGPVGLAVKDVVYDGAYYFTSAGNANSTDSFGNNISSYEALAYRPTTCPILFFNGNPFNPGLDCHDFNDQPSLTDVAMTYLVQSQGGIRAIFQWGEPWHGLKNDFDIFVTDSIGNVLGLSIDDNFFTPNRSPVEVAGAGNPTIFNQEINIVIARKITSDFSRPPIKFVLTAADGVIAADHNATTNPTDRFGSAIYGHHSTPEAISVAAISVLDTTVPEPFTSHGNPVHLFTPALGIEPAQPYVSPFIIAKPEIAATDGNRNSFFGSPGCTNATPCRFFGTSSAAPHAAGVAALMKQAADAQNLFVNNWKLIQVMRDTATPYPLVADEVLGAGLINATLAVASMNPVNTFTILDPNFQQTNHIAPRSDPQKTVIRVSKPEPFLTRGKFNVLIGGDTANVISVYEAANEYVLEVKPPSKATDGPFDLQVTANTSFGLVSDTQGFAYLYNDDTNVNVVLTIDRSGSMLFGNKLQQAKNAASLFVDLAKSGNIFGSTPDKIGVVSFADEATVDFPLVDATPANKLLAKANIALLQAGGLTATGDGLRRSQDILFSGDPSAPWAIVLLSDGFEYLGNEPRGISPRVDEVLPGYIIPYKTEIHTIGLGGIANEPELLEMAQKTGGTYSLSPSTLELAATYDRIAGDLNGDEILFTYNGIVRAQTETVYVNVDSSSRSMTFPVYWSNSGVTLSMTLRDPNGRTITAAAANNDPDIWYFGGPTYLYYIIKGNALVPGLWEMQVRRETVLFPTETDESDQVNTLADDGEPFSIQVIGDTDLTTQVYSDKAEYNSNEPIELSVSISDLNPVTGSTVLAVTGPLVKISPENVNTKGAAAVFNLIDDGSGNDKVANDGIYTGVLPASETANDGTYTFSIFARGTTNSNEEFTRELQYSVFVGDKTVIETLSDDIPKMTNQVYLPTVIK
ncbi:MAG: VWA domain-containing protein [Anaerolineaceae bacterium]|nr:VWA domain-containing protein [Anaerolineaceae bacterium]